MEKLYLVKLGNMYVTSASLTSIKLDETVEKAKVFKNVVEAESIANTLGAIVITSEESAELIQAISKVKRYGFHDKYEENLHEEVADVLICIAELVCLGYLDIDKVKDYQKLKINREIERAIQKEELRKEAKKYDNCE